MSINKTMTDIAYESLNKKKKRIAFVQLWDEVVKHMDIPEEKKKRKKSQFYSELLLDNRFVSFENNSWDLRNRHKFSEIHIDKDEIALDDDENELDNMELDLPKGDDAFDN